MSDRSTSGISPVAQEYLEAVHKLIERENPVRPASLARRLKVSSPSVWDMLKRLQAQGLVERSEDGGVMLTDTGRREAARVVRRHRLAERFLVDILGLPWPDVHEEACRLEHDLSAESEQRMAEMLRGVETCPHGHPIPDAEGNIVEQATKPLSDFKTQECGSICRIEDENSEQLRYFASLGLLPGVEVAVEEKAPFSGPLLVKIGQARYALGRDVACHIHMHTHEGHHKHSHEDHHSHEGHHSHEDHHDRSHKGHHSHEDHHTHPRED